MFSIENKMVLFIKIRLFFGVLVIHFLLNVLIVSAQTSPEVIRFKSSGFDLAARGAKDAAGNIYLAASLPRNNRQTAFAVLKYNSEGRFVWAAHYNASQGGFNGSAIETSVDAAGNVFAIGYVQPDLVSRSSDYLVVKFNSDGVEQWAHRIYSASGARIAVEQSTGNVYAVGNVGSAAGSDWLTIKYANDGTRLWQRTFSSVSTGTQPATVDSVADMALDSQGNIIVTGTSQTLGNGFPFDISTVKYDSNGNELFQATFNDREQSNDLPFDLDVDPSGNIWITGITELSPYDPTFPITLKYAPEGQLLFALRNETVGGRSIDVDAAGDVYLAGSGAAAKFRSDGVKIWERPLTFPAVRILSDSNGSSYVSGSTPRFGAPTSGDYFTAKFDSLGNQIFQHVFNGVGNGNDQVSDILLDNSENLFVFGNSRIDSNSFEDVVTLKFTNGSTPVPPALAAPSSLAASGGRRQISLRWQDNASSESGFSIERCQGSNCTDFAEIAATSANATSFTDTGLAKSTVFRYRVRAFNAGGSSDFSNVDSARTNNR